MIVVIVKLIYITLMIYLQNNVFQIVNNIIIIIIAINLIYVQINVKDIFKQHLH